MLPRIVHPGDAGADVCAAEEVVLAPGETKVVPLGFKVAIPVGYEIQVRPRSGISLRTRLRLPNSIGTIDAGYRGEVGVVMHNASVPGDPTLATEELSLDEKQNRPGTYRIRIGERVAQLVVAEVPPVEWETVDSVDHLGEDRGGGLGHSGV